MISRLRYAWFLAVLFFLPGCATKPTPTPVSAARTFEWPEWKPTPLALLGPEESQPVWYSVTIPDARRAPTRTGRPVAVAKPIPVPALLRPEPAKRRGKIAVEYAVVGKDLKLEASAEGSPPFFYQWKKGGRPLAGAVHPQLPFKPFKAEDAGEYTCVVSNAHGWQESQPVKLMVRKQ